MESISFKLEVFEGPLDLLLSLIAKHKLNICDIEISKLLEQYLLYMDQAHEQGQRAAQLLMKAIKGDRNVYKEVVPMILKIRESSAR